MSRTWRCPYCNQFATITGIDVSTEDHRFDNNNRLGQVVLRTFVTVCPNDACREAEIHAWLLATTATIGPSRQVTFPPLVQWPLKPNSSAKPIPNYVPAQIRSDYEEACLIATLSPKASATLSRRCLQGMIRDFWNIAKPTLFQEINALEDKMDTTTWSAIDAVRSIGNIGAHMEKDIDLIVDVEPEEAALLIGLIETLIEEWYVHRYSRNAKMAAIIAVAASKKEQKVQPADAEALPRASAAN